MERAENEVQVSCSPAASVPGLGTVCPGWACRCPELRQSDPVGTRPGAAVPDSPGSLSDPYYRLPLPTQQGPSLKNIPHPYLAANNGSRFPYLERYRGLTAGPRRWVGSGLRAGHKLRGVPVSWKQRAAEHGEVRGTHGWSLTLNSDRCLLSGFQPPGQGHAWPWHPIQLFS